MKAQFMAASTVTWFVSTLKEDRMKAIILSVASYLYIYVIEIEYG